MNNSSQNIIQNTLGYNLPSTSVHQHRTETAADSSGLDMGSGGTTNGAPSDREFTSNTSAGPSKKTLPANGKKTKGRVKIKMEFIDNKLRRYTTFSKRKTGIMKKAYELSTLTGTQVMLLVASETGHVYTFATRKLQPMITSEAGKALIQTCLNSPDPPPGLGGSSNLDQRMSATGFEETDLTYTVGDECEKFLQDGRSGNYSSSPGSPNSTDDNCPPHTIRSPSPQMIHLAVDSKADISGQKQQVSSGNAGFATILTGSAAVQIGSFHGNGENSISSSGSVDNPSSLYRFSNQGTSQPVALAISGTSKNPNSANNSSQSTISVVQNPQQNLSLLSGNVMIPASQALLQPGGNNIGGNNVTGTLMYHTTQGLMYATPTSLPDGVIFNIGQEQGGQQYISIPVSLSLTPAQQQLMQPVTTTCQITGCSPAKKEKSFK